MTQDKSLYEQLRFVSGQLQELHAIAVAHNPKAPSPEAVAAFHKRHEETLARIGPEKAWENVLRALNHREIMSPDERKANEAAWDAWDDARDPHEKTKLMLRLAETVASWMSHADALERELERMRLRYEECAQCHGSLEPSTQPPHCHDCTVDEPHEAEWADAVGA